ncbi:hypothetical protein [uncultured Adlercreutzia sp.]|uniref:hypothetical protein n=1 Tax=uncultured Adlercreutzia sp. TaxID=875803 RepID=UPI002676567D|nr:hypothetical protein [uncultured Adlercreutzia sp.]
MAKKDLRAQMDAARAAAAFIGAAQEAHDDLPAARASSQTESVAYEVVSTNDGGREGALAADMPSARPAPDAPVSEPAILSDGERGSAPAGVPAASEEVAQVGKTVHQVKSAASDVTMPATTPDFFVEGGEEASSVSAEAEPAPSAPKTASSSAKPRASRARKPRKKAPEPVEEVSESSARMTAQVLVPMTAEQREHADLLAQVMKVTRAEVMRQALDEYWSNHKSELQAAVMAYEELIKKLMK